MLPVTELNESVDEVSTDNNLGRGQVAARQNIVLSLLLASLVFLLMVFALSTTLLQPLQVLTAQGHVLARTMVSELNFTNFTLVVPSP